MKLLFDIGNTRIKWALAAAGEFRHHGSAVQLDECLDRLARELSAEVAVAWAVNVGGPEIETRLRHELGQRFGIALNMQRTLPQFGSVINGYDSPEQLGADRWAAIVGAWHHYRERICVVDAGTALTIDIVEASGQHSGGIIVPGLHLMTAALKRETSDIGGFAASSKGPASEQSWYGKDTLSAIQRGALFALQATVRRAATPAPGADPLRLIVTGGDAPALLPLEGIAAELRPELVLEGLHILSGGDDA